MRSECFEVQDRASPSGRQQPCSNRREQQCRGTRNLAPWRTRVCMPVSQSFLYRQPPIEASSHYRSLAPKQPDLVATVAARDASLHTVLSSLAAAVEALTKVRRGLQDS